MIDQAIRLTGIGASEVGAVLGLNPYVSPLDVYLEKRQEMPSFSGNEHTRLGKRMEAPILAEYAERTEQAVVPLFDETFRSKTHEFMLASPDAKLVAKPKLVEVKNVGARMAHNWGDVGTDQIPEMYLLQVAAQMHVMDVPEVDIAALIGGNDFRIYTMERDADLEKMVVGAVEKFWQGNVLAAIMPEIRDTERTREWLKKRYPRDVELLRPANEEESELMLSLKSARGMRETLETKENELKLQLQAMVGDAEGIAGDGFKLTWKLDGGKKSYTVKEQPPKRVFRPTWQS